MIKVFFSDYRTKAVILFLFGLALGVSLVTYTPSDPSMNLASDNVPGNFMSIPGAYIADFLYQSIGLASLILPLCMISWAVQLIRGREVRLLVVRLLLLVLALVPLSIAFSSLKFAYLPSDGGGALGRLFFEQISLIDIPYGSGDTLLLTSIGLGVLLAFFALAIPLGAYIDSLLLIWNTLAYPFRSLGLADKISDKLSKFDPGEAFYAEEGFKEKGSRRAAKAQNNVMPPLEEPEYMQRTFEQPEQPKRVAPALEPRRAVPAPVSDVEGSLPSLELLDEGHQDKVKMMSRSELEQNAQELMKVLSDFGVKGQILDVKQGPVVTLYEFEPAAGTKSSRVIGLADDIARSLSALSTRIAVIPGRNALGIELPNKERMFFRLKELLETDEFQGHKQLLPLVLGKDLGGNPYIADLAKMPHLLVAGTTGSGKSVAINAMIMSLLYRYRPDECKMIMIDPKMLELSAYDDIPHLLTPVVTEPGKAVVALKWAVKEMENRYRLMSHLGVRNIANYNSKIQEAIKSGKVLERTIQTGFDPETGRPIHETVPIEMENMPYIVVIVDEMADLMLVAGKDIESSIQRLAQMARAAGIHIIMATQRPSVDVITGVIKANFPSRISFRVTSKIDARTILSEQGSEQLLGMGDMLFMGSSSKILRVHGPFVDDKEVERVTNYLRSTGTPNYVSAVTEDQSEMDSMMEDPAEGGDGDLYQQAVSIVKTQRKSSISYIQRSLRIGYNKAANLVDEMERNGVLSPANHSGKREILLPEE